MNNSSPPHPNTILLGQREPSFTQETLYNSTAAHRMLQGKGDSKTESRVGNQSGRLRTLLQPEMVP